VEGTRVDTLSNTRKKIDPGSPKKPWGAADKKQMGTKEKDSEGGRKKLKND